MVIPSGEILDEFVRAGALLSQEQSFRSRIVVLVEQTIDISVSDLACLYLKKDLDDPKSDFRLVYKRGKYDVPDDLSREGELLSFMAECKEAVVVTERKKSPFAEIFLNSRMQCGIALPLLTPKISLGVLILNSIQPLFYTRAKFHFLDAYTKLAGGILHNAKLFQEMKEYLNKIEELERYQENIFSSMTNLLVTTDKAGKIVYSNAVANARMELTDGDMNTDFTLLFNNRLGKRTLKAIEESGTSGKDILGVEGILKGKDQEDMDFSLNISPLKNKRGAVEGNIFLFTDQTRERELQQEVMKVVEERRMIKDMFSRYLSLELVQHLMDQPELVRPFGDKKQATVFFADIRGYTAFSEGQEPEYIIEILNAYFTEAVEIVIQHKGFIDKFIGDCIMAAWGVPLQTVEEDAINAVTCALEIQKLVNSEERCFFKGKAAGLRIGIGMHTGPLVAGNLGSSRRMDYTVIGDTVNLAARLEGVARAGEVIITEDTRRYLGDRFVLEKREPVRVKGKEKLIPIFAVHGVV